MSPLAFINHLFNFIAPALAVGYLCALAGLIGRIGARGAESRMAWWKQGLVNFAAGATALAGGLIALGQDGRLASYAALVLACGTSQWIVSRGWRR
jgi:hypothetical protein